MYVPATHLGFDDTDSPQGMCTTFLATLMLKELRDYDLIGLPRLVRLNPNVPWKTRGNAAVCLSLGKGTGESALCGEIDGRPLRAFDKGTPVDQDEVLAIATDVVESVAEFDCKDTNPGVVVTNRSLPQSLYWRAVRELVPLSDVERDLRAARASWRKYKNGRGVIGASSSIAWRPHDRTWEVISYRVPGRIGTKRDIDVDSVIEMDRSTPSSFHNYDPHSRHLAICPASPCPVLFGIRGDDPDQLLMARQTVKGEAARSWLLFLTNQATDDHIVQRRVSQLAPFMSARVEAAVSAAPRTIEGGHVFVTVADDEEIDVAFYEPSGEMANAARRLAPGDRIVVYGSVRKSPRSLNAEKFRIKSLAPVNRKVGNPVCTECGKRMGSLGRGKGYRCKRCGERAPADSAEMKLIDRELQVGWHEPPVPSRRHLYRPVRRMTRGHINNLL